MLGRGLGGWTRRDMGDGAPPGVVDAPPLAPAFAALAALLFRVGRRDPTT